MEIIEFKIRRFKELIKGILLGDGARWSFVRLNVVDYVLDGFQFTNKSHVTNSNWINKDTILYKILSIKNDSNDILSMIDLNILDDDTLMYSFLNDFFLYITKIKSRILITTEGIYVPYILPFNESLHKTTKSTAINEVTTVEHNANITDFLYSRFALYLAITTPEI